MSMPYGQRTLRLKLPKYHPAVGVACQETCVLAHEAHAVDVCSVAAEDVFWVCWRKCRGHLS